MTLFTSTLLRLDENPPSKQRDRSERIRGLTYIKRSLKKEGKNRSHYAIICRCYWW